MPKASPCPVCDEVVVRSSNAARAGGPISIPDTIQALLCLIAADKMRLLRADVPLEDMLALAGSELRYTIVCFLECQRCRATKFWNLCIRGEPLYRTCEPGAEKDWPWEPVPPRSEWTHELPHR